MGDSSFERYAIDCHISALVHHRLAIEELIIHSDISVFVIKDFLFTRPKFSAFSTLHFDGTLCVKSRSPEHFMF